MLEFALSVLVSKLFWTTSFFLGIYVYLKFVTFNYWKKQGIPHEAPTIVLGNVLPVVLGKQCIGNLFGDSYEKFKSYPFHGLYMYHVPHLIINDPDLIRLILIKDFAHFHDRGIYFNKKVDPLSGNMFLLPGEEWKFIRSKLSPTFTSGKIKQMFPLLEKVGKDLSRVLDDSIEKSANVLDFKDLLSRYTTDVIASIVFGLECNSLSDPEAEFRIYGQKCVDTDPIKLPLAMFFPKLLDILKISLFPSDVSGFFNKVFRDTIAYRRSNNVRRKDFLNLLMQLLDHGEVEEDDEGDSTVHSKIGHSTDTISISEACAQAFIFFLAGFETSSSTSTYCLQELALNEGVQQKLRKEIKETLGDRRDLTYEEVYEMPYLHKVVLETLRKYPILAHLNRVCTKDYQIPDSDYCIPKGMNVIIPVLGLQKDSRVYPDPEKFMPERFDSDEVAERHAFMYLPFGEGPRICIGKRFGFLQVKVALIKILSEYKISVCEKTKIPVEFTTHSILIYPGHPVFLKFEKVL